MGLRMYNVMLTPRGRMTSIVSPDGKNWFTQDGRPVNLKDIHHDSTGADFLSAVFFAAFLFGAVYGICWLFG